jgi:hypothetical protein
MAGITLQQAEAKLAEYLAAETQTLQSQRYRIADREQQRAMLESIQAGIEVWNSRVLQLSDRMQGRSRGRTVVPAR